MWEFARNGDFVIATKDADFADLSVLLGAPPKLVWIRRGNCSTDEILGLLRSHATAIEAMALLAAERVYIIE